MRNKQKDKKSLLKNLTAFLVIVCLLCGFIAPTTAITADAAAPASYTVITADSTASVNIASSGSAQYFKFVPSKNGSYQFYSTGSVDSKGSLLDSSGATIVTDDDSGTNYNFSITYDCTANTTYYIKAYLFDSSATGSYTLNVKTISINNNTVVNIDAANGTNYPLFNSGRTGIGANMTGTLYDDALNPAPSTFTNNGYDVYVRANTNNASCTSASRIGLSFKMNIDVTEPSTLAIYAYDVDEEQGEKDGIYLVNDTTGVETKLGILSGMNESWFNTSFSIPSNLLLRGNTYHIKVKGESSTWCVYVRTVGLIINGPGPTPIEADLEASISSSGTVTANLAAKASSIENYTLEYKAVCCADSAQYGGKEYSVTIPATTTSFGTSFQLESVAQRGTYDITVFIKNASGNVVATRTVQASYGYSAVSYNSNGGSQNHPTDGTTYSSGDTVTVKFDSVPSRYGYVFLGWSTDRNANEPMYTENGLKTFTIGASDVTLYAVWAIAECHHNWTETSRTPATCTADGVINYKCSCGETRVDIIRAHGHNIVTTVENEVTCTSDGLIVDRCINAGCNYEKRTVIHGEHNYSVTGRQEATCDTAGYVEYTCSNCGDKYYEYIEGRHNYVESSRVEPAVGVDGIITYTCTVCGDSYSVAIPALNPVLKNSAVLLIQNSLPWAENVNTSLLETLKGRGVVSYYNIIKTSAIASTDLTQYGVVFIANDQSTSTYNELAANAEILENYVRAGGNLIYGACDEGWGGCGSLTHNLPGGVATSNYYSVHNYIVNALHPVVTGVYTDNRSLRDELLKGNYCSHTYFIKESLPEGTDIILRDANGNPTLIEYNLGDGTVIASVLPGSTST